MTVEVCPLFPCAMTRGHILDDTLKGLKGFAKEINGLGDRLTLSLMEAKTYLSMGNRKYYYNKDISLKPVKSLSTMPIACI